MSEGKTLAFHSYKGGTGKTTLIANLAATFAMRGMRVCLLDCDFYAPSLSMYFRKKPKVYLNDLLAGDAEIFDVLVDLSSELDINGELFVGFASPRKEDVHEIEIAHNMNWQYDAIRRFLAANKKLFSENKIDYVFLDTSPGIRYWSLNTIATADLLFLLMKISDVDIIGTKRMIRDIYESLAELGSKYFIILNKTPGASPINEYQEKQNHKMLWESEIEKELDTHVVCSVPCFCDVQFNKHEYLTVLRNPDHPFSKNVLDIANKIEEIV
jgi:MinD-like ATPase involved in chromosome partitioning or flagellar assembly